MPGEPLCPEHALRAAMTDQEFWSHVYPAREDEDEGPCQLDEEDIIAMSHIDTQCPECGQFTACAYDQEGRAMIHVTEETA